MLDFPVCLAAPTTTQHNLQLTVLGRERFMRGFASDVEPHSSKKILLLAVNQSKQATNSRRLGESFET